MAACTDLTGKTFGELIIISKSSRRASNGGVYWNCRCSCGCEKEILGQSLKNGRTISCGHIGQENLKIGRGLNFQDLSGQHFGQLLVLKRIEDKILSSGDKKVQYECLCSCGRKTNVLSDNLKKGNTQSCGFCGERSHGNIKISQLLDTLDIPYEREKRFSSCKDKLPLPFDFYVDNKYLIEYDGKQHFKDEGLYDYEKTHLHDLIKSQWCKENDIPLIRIPYTHYEDLIIEDLLLETSNFIEK